MTASTTPLTQTAGPPGARMGISTSYRARRVADCLGAGAPAFETVWPAGYDRPIVRCARCLVLKKQHRSPPA